MAAQQHDEPDMAQFFDFSEAEMPDIPQAVANCILTPSPQIAPLACLFHQDEACLCASALDDLAPNAEFDLLPDVTDATDPAIRIPKFSRPDAPCEYCRTMKFDCFYSYEDQKSCTSCTALFRPCSFIVQPTKGAMATLHPLIEDQTIEQGTQTGLIHMKSWNYAAGVPRGAGDDDPSLPGRKAGIRFSRDNVKILKAWMEQHRDHPYPTEEEKEGLCQRTGLKPIQVSNWLANTRRRTKQAMRTPSSGLPSWSGNASDAIDIRPNKQGITHKSKEWMTLTPMDRWKISPPENEPAAVEDIAQAVATSTLTPPDSASLQPTKRPRGLESSGNSDSASLWKARSTASLDTGFSALSSESFSNASLHSALSYASSRNSFNSFGSKVSKEQRRRRRTAANPSKRANADDTRLFQCTFCTDTFKSKYDWSRHEKSLHLSLEKWICSPIGEVLTDPATSTKKCVFCGENDPTPSHLEQHNYRACEEKGLQARTFYRKDHLRQHLRLMHNCKMTPAMEAWKSEATYIKCRCGFCGAEFNRWNDRVDHIAKHFRNRAHMKDWRGCRGFEPSVGAQVTNAMPPYLIANEAKSPFPFSATNESSIRHCTAPFMINGGLGQDLEAILPHVCLDTKTDYNLQGEHGQGSLPSLTVSPSLPTPPSASLSNPQPNLLDPFGRTTNGRTTCWEILTVRLGRFVAEQALKSPGAPITDEMLQRKARLILYDEDDSWNQTAADNPEWLSLFKQAHGLVGKEQLTEPNGVSFGEDLGVGDLTFDHFFEGDSGIGALGGLNLADDTQFPSSAALEATAGFGFEALMAPSLNAGAMAGSSASMEFEGMGRTPAAIAEETMLDFDAVFTS